MHETNPAVRGAAPGCGAWRAKGLRRAILFALLSLLCAGGSLRAQRPRGIGRPRVPRAGRRGGRRGRGCGCETQLDLHGAFATGTGSSLRSWGGGVGVRTTYGRTADPIRVVVAPGIDFLRQQGGARVATAALDLDLQGGGRHAVRPYAGVSAGANWSSAAQWAGVRLGLGTQAGAVVAFRESHWRLKAEERFGYVDGQEHSLATRVGVLWSF